MRCCNQLTECVWRVRWMYSKILFCFSLTPAYAVFSFCIFSSLRRGTVSQSVTLIQCRCKRNFKHHLLDYMTEIQCGKMCEMIDSIHFSASETNDERKERKRKCNEMYHISCDLCAHSIRYGYLEYRLFLAGTFTSICHLISSVHLILICCKGLRYTQTHCRKHYGNFYV